MEQETSHLTSHLNGWDIVVAKTRVDSFNQHEIAEAINALRQENSRKIAIDLRATRFLSLPAIKSIVRAAREMKETGGQMALLCPTEKTKKHFVIYGSLDDLEIIRNSNDIVSRRTRELESAPPETEL